MPDDEATVLSVVSPQNILHPLTQLTLPYTCHLQDIQTFNIWYEFFEMDTTSLEEQHIL
jgi:hypothetical protein